MKIEIVESTTARLNQAFDKSGLRQADLVDRTGIDKGSISLYLKGKVVPKGDKLYMLAIALGVDPVWLSGFDVPMVPQTAPDNYVLNEFEREIIDTYRKADGKQKLRILSLISDISDEIEKNHSGTNGNGASA